jgi:hypothetical protein
MMGPERRERSRGKTMTWFILANPAVLCILVWLIARDSAEIVYGTMYLIALVVGLFAFGITSALGLPFGLLGMVPLVLVLAGLLVRYCYVNSWQAFLASVLYFIFQLGFCLFLEKASR